MSYLRRTQKHFFKKKISNLKILLIHFNHQHDFVIDYLVYKLNLMMLLQFISGEWMDVHNY
jgi:hypothetical protein